MDPATLSLLYQILIGVVPVALAAAHAHGYKLPILSGIFDLIFPKTVPLTPAVPVPDAPAAPHPILVALSHLLANVLAGRGVAGLTATQSNADTVDVKLTLTPKV